MQSLTPSLPFHFRVTSLVRLPIASGAGVMNEAILYHDDAQFKACWTSRHVDTRLKRGSCVALRGARFQQFREGSLPVSRLDLIDKPIPTINPFLTIPTAWCADRDIACRAAALWEQMGRPLQYLFNAVMWDGGRFYRYVTGPVGCSDYPWEPGRNFKHAVTVAEQAATLSRSLSGISTPVLVAAALLHDAGKADDYQLSAEGYVLSERGLWVGYQHTILEWLAVARTRAIIPDALYLALVHALIARRHLEAREVPSMEARVLAAAERLSCDPVSDALAH